MRADVDMRVECLQPFARDLDLGAPDARAVEQDLPLQVRFVDAVPVDDAERAHARCREVQRRGRTEPARADDQHARGLELFLAREPDFLEVEVPLVATRAWRDLSRRSGRGLSRRYEALEAPRLFALESRGDEIDERANLG